MIVLINFWAVLPTDSHIGGWLRW